MNVEEKFKAALFARFDEAEAAIPGYKFTIIREMIEERGAIVTAKHLVDLNKIASIQYGLDVLAKNDLLRCSVEQAVVDFADCGEFSPADIDSSKARLLIAKRKRR
jgi:hypothetical protein